MRQNQQNRRGRGRSGRKSQNPLSRSYESSGPDIKIRGTAQHIAEKYMSLARDAIGSGDLVLGENYLQHAEHYNRIILASQPTQQPGGIQEMGANGQRVARPEGDLGDGDGFDGDDEMDGDQPAGFESQPRGFEGQGQGQPQDPHPQQNQQPYQPRQNQQRFRDNRNFEPRGGYDNRNNNQQRNFEPRGEHRGQDFRGQDHRRNNNNNNNNNERRDNRENFEQRYRELPSFLTAGINSVPPATVNGGDSPPPPLQPTPEAPRQASEDRGAPEAGQRVRRRRSPRPFPAQTVEGGEQAAPNEARHDPIEGGDSSQD